MRENLFTKKEEPEVAKREEVKREEAKREEVSIRSSHQWSAEGDSESVRPPIRVEEYNESTIGDKIGKAWDYFADKVVNIFKDDEDGETIPKTKVIKAIENETYKLNKEIQKAWDFIVELLKIYPIYVKRYHEDKYWRLYSRIVEEKRLISRQIYQLDEIVPGKELKAIAQEMKQLRRDYLQSGGLETARGLIGEKCIFRERKAPIFYEEILEWRGGSK